MKNFKIEIKWALIFIVVQLIWMFLEKAVGLHDEHISKHLIFTNFFAIVAIIVYVLALRDKKNTFFKGTMNWKQGFISGIVISALVAAMSPLSQYIINTFITPEYFKNVIAFATESGTMSLEDAQSYFSLKSYMMQSAFGALAMGVVTAAVVAFFIKSKETTN